jgi:hypothetical protein
MTYRNLFTWFVFSALMLAVLPLSNAYGASCPNEELRAELQAGRLPDCRAYELVTPAYKAGTVMTEILAISGDGSRMIGSSLGTFASSKDDSLGVGTSLVGAAYEFSRETGSDWSASSLAPPASEYVSGGLFGASVDLTSSLWELETRSQPEDVSDLYLEEPRGTFTEIGRATPSPTVVNRDSGGPVYSVLGESADLSRVLFTTPSGFHWPLDGTAEGAATLYEYVGTSPTVAEREAREPQLVGVTGNADSSTLVSRCGTRLGSSTLAEGNGSMYNAISRGGGRVFFTAVGADDKICDGGPPAEPPADELFAREAPPSGSSPSGETRTIAISCPETAAPCKDANFEGASLDGSKVFFTSTQKLVEGASEDNAPEDGAVSVKVPNEPEARGCAQTVPGQPGCNLYEDELSGSGPALKQKLILVSRGSPDPRVQGVTRISEDGSHIYFVSKSLLTGENSQGNAPTLNEDNLYVFERDERYPEGHTSFIATLSPTDSPPGKGEGDWSRADHRPALISWNGRYLVFTSVADLTHEDISGTARQVFEYDAAAERLVRASIGSYGYNNNGATPLRGSTLAVGPAGGYTYAVQDSPTQTAGVLAPEAGEAFFESPDALTTNALSDKLTPAGGFEPNIYEYQNGNIYLISDGQDVLSIFSNPSVQLLGSDASGANVFFMTSDSLVPQDTNTQQDVYDARIDGGFPAPRSASGCAGELCQGAPGGLPSLPSASSTVQAEAALPPASESVRGKVKPKARKKIKKTRRRRAKKAGTRYSTRAKAWRR